MARSFPTTHWSIVLTAADRSDPGGRAALAELCEAYWPPLYAFIRRRGASADDALDLTQAYFAQLLEKETLGDVQPERGRFRSFLLASLKNFLANEWDRAHALKRGGEQHPLSIDTEETEGRLQLEAMGELNPEQVFEQRWALRLLERAMQRLSEEARGTEARERFERLKVFLTAGEAPDAYRGVAGVLGSTEGAIKTAVYRLRRRFGELLREEVARTVVRAADVDDELRHLLRALAPQ